MSEGGKYDKRLNAIENFVLSGAAAVISKTASAPIERVKLLIQNQDEMLKAGRLDKPYKGPIDCFRRVSAEEGTASFWKGNLANCIRYFPTQALNFMFKDEIKKMFSEKKNRHLCNEIWQKRNERWCCRCIIIVLRLQLRLRKNTFSKRC